MPKLFVSRGERIEVQVHVYDEPGGETGATHDSSEIPKNVEAETYNFLFRKPSYSDSHRMVSSSTKMANEEGMLSVDALALQDELLRGLLVDWDIKKENGEKMPCNRKAIGDLHPSVARASALGLMERISLY